MAAKNIQSDDLILVNRGGVDYQAKVSDLPIEDAGLEEAPNDGEQYVRQSEAWEKIEIPAAGLEEAPIDSSIYGRKNGAWEAMARYMPYDITTLPEL